MERMISSFGLLVMIGLAWLMSSHKTRVRPRIILGGLLLQFVFAFIVLKTQPGRIVFAGIGEFFNQVLGFVDDGSRFMFEMDTESPGQDGSAALPPRTRQLLTSFAFGVLPTIVFFSSLMSVLYHLGVVQRVVDVLARIMRKTLGTSGSETLSTAANIFVGQTEAPLVVRPYVASMTQSELMAVMVGGFATIAGGVMAAYVGMGINAGHLLSASVISAPAALLIAKVMQPETEQSKTLGHVVIDVPRKSANVIEAAAIGATDGLKLALNVAAMLIAFLALIAMLDATIGLAGRTTGYLLGYDDWRQWNWSLTAMLGYAFAPLAWVMGIESKDCLPAGRLLGIKMVANEFVAYFQLSQWTKPGSEIHLSPRTILILTYALCGFANFSSIGIQLGGIGSIAPERRTDLARLGFRAMLGGTLAAFMTACVAGILLEE